MIWRLGGCHDTAGESVKGGRGFTLKASRCSLHLGQIWNAFLTLNDHIITIRQRLGRSEQIVIV